MILSLDKQKLENSLFFVEKVIAKSSTNPQYHGVQFLFKDKNLYLYASNGTILCEVLYPDIEVEPMSRIVDFILLDKVVSLSDSEKITLDFREDALYISDAKSEYKMAYMVTQDYSTYFTSITKPDKEICKIKLSAIARVSSFITACLPTKTNFAQLYGVFFDGNFVATNSYSLAVCPMLPKPLGKLSFFLSSESFSLLSKLVAESDIAYFYNVGTGLVATIDTTTYILSTMANEFPNYKIVFDRFKKHTRTVTISKATAIKCCKKLVSFTDKHKRNSVGLTFREKELIIAASSDTKQGKEVLSIKDLHLEEEISFSINLVKFLDYLSHIYNSETTLSFGESLTEYALKDGDSVYIESILN